MPVLELTSGDTPKWASGPRYHDCDTMEMSAASSRPLNVVWWNWRPQHITMMPPCLNSSKRKHECYHLHTTQRCVLSNLYIMNMDLCVCVCALKLTAPWILRFENSKVSNSFSQKERARCYSPLHWKRIKNIKNKLWGEKNTFRFLLPFGSIKTTFWLMYLIFFFYDFITLMFNHGYSNRWPPTNLFMFISLLQMWTVGISLKFWFFCAVQEYQG